MIVDEKNIALKAASHFVSKGTKLKNQDQTKASRQRVWYWRKTFSDVVSGNVIKYPIQSSFAYQITG